jgi:hypothetical protein
VPEKVRYLAGNEHQVRCATVRHPLLQVLDDLAE